MAPSRNSMKQAWSTARRLLAFVFVTFLLSAAFIVLENRAHIDNGFVHVISVVGAGLVSLILVQGFKIFEGIGF